MEPAAHAAPAVVDSSGEAEACTQHSGTQQQMAEEFNMQRAKMKELFLQKEEEVKRVMREKQQLESELTGLRQQLEQLQTLSQNQRSEIESLQFLVHETVEASSNETGEVRQLQTRCLELEQQLNLLNKQQAASQDLSLAPSVLVQAVTKRIARKLGADPSTQDTLDDSMKKAQEDAELLRSLVVPLEEEIHVLKDKLRETDTKLQQATQINRKTVKAGDSKGGGESDARCDMCANYEEQLVAEQAKCVEATARARNANLALNMATQELEQAASVQADTAGSWQAERTAAAAQLATLEARLSTAERALAEVSEAAARANEETLERLTELTVNREMLQERLNTLEQENDMLVGKYTKKASELQSEEINLPDNVMLDDLLSEYCRDWDGAGIDALQRTVCCSYGRLAVRMVQRFVWCSNELQEYALRLREELIVACVGREAAMAAEEGLRSEMLIQGGVMRETVGRHQALAHQHKVVRQQLESLEAERRQFQSLSDQLRASEADWQESQEEKRKLAAQVQELRGRVSSLQQELDNNEKVQQDFVRLSQSLQVELERIREADTEVRWQHDEDVVECPACRTHLPANRRKLHCRHCGRIFCAACLSRTVLSGPRKAPSHVCTVCHTLLERNTAPYFSTEPPHSPE